MCLQTTVNQEHKQNNTRFKPGGLSSCASTRTRCNGFTEHVKISVKSKQYIVDIFS